MPSFLLNLQVKSPPPPLETDPTGPHLGVPGGGGGGGPLRFSTNDFCDYLRRRITPIIGDIQYTIFVYIVYCIGYSIYLRTKDCDGLSVEFFWNLVHSKARPKYILVNMDEDV